MAHETLPEVEEVQRVVLGNDDPALSVTLIYKGQTEYFIRVTRCIYRSKVLTHGSAANEP